MRLGYALPQVGSFGDPAAIAAVAKRAEALHFDSLWVLDRTLYPLDPQTPYPLGTLPEQFKQVLDPIEILTFAAAHTTEIGLGTGIINLPYYNPLLLARRLTTLDILSAGRLRVGVGIGWSLDEYEAAGVPWEGRGDRMGEAVQVLKAIWTTDPVEFQGEFYRVPKSIIGPKPIQQPHPPIYMAAYVRPAMQRVAQLADGWFPVGIPLDAVSQMFDGIKGMVQEAGRDPEDLYLIVRANLVISETPLGDDRTDYYGTMEQIEGDFAKTRELGADELIVDLQFSPDVQSTDDILARMETIRGMVD